MYEQVAAKLVFLAPAIIAVWLGVTPEEKVEVKQVTEPTESAEEAEPPSTEAETPKQYAQRRITEEFGPDHWESFDRLIDKESGWNSTVCNSQSTACGLGQFLASTRRAYGITVESQPNDQIEAVISYIKDRYSNPIEAWRFHQNKNWY